MKYPQPVVFLVSAPSGAGKTTLCKRLLGAEAGLRFSVSCTTRPPRAGEREGVDYFFLDRERFEREISEGAFLEYAKVHGNYYGTRMAFVREAVKGGESVLLDVDVQGGEQIRRALFGEGGDPVIRDAFVDVFVHPPTLEVLRERIESRGTEDAEVIQRRLRNAEVELAEAGKYMYQVVNGDLEEAFEVFRAVYRATAHRTRGREG